MIDSQLFKLSITANKNFVKGALLVSGIDFFIVYIYY